MAKTTKPDVYVDDEGDTVIEWINKDWRFGLIFSDKPENRGWYYVNKDLSQSDSGEGLPKGIEWLKSKPLALDVPSR